MVNDWNKWGEVPICPDCGQNFSNIFDAIGHFLEDGEVFDPALVLPGNYRLMIGSLLRSIYENRFSPKLISEITQSTYFTLFTAETEPDLINQTVEDIIVDTEMENFDVQLKRLFKNGE